jgi:SUN domain-containing protein 1/2
VALLIKFVPLEVFSGSRLPTIFTLRWGQYEVDVYVMRRPRPVLRLSPLLEYASLSAGGRTIEALTSTTYSPPSSGRHIFFSRKKTPRQRQTPGLALTDGMEPGKCWPFDGDAGQLGIQLVHPIRISHLSVGYPNTSRVTAAPKALVLWGLKPADSEVCATLGDVGTRTPDFGSGYCGIRLLSGSYEPEFSMPMYYQNFTTTADDSYDRYFDRIVFQVLGNWGHADFTCIYRIWVYGRAQ